MAFSTYDEALDRAAETWGIQPDYWDIFGNRHVTSPQTKRAILESLGIPADTKEGLEQALEEKTRAEWSRLLPPCVVVSENQGRENSLSICPRSLPSWMRACF